MEYRTGVVVTNKGHRLGPTLILRVTGVVGASPVAVGDGFTFYFQEGGSYVEAAWGLATPMTKDEAWMWDATFGIFFCS